MNLVSNVVINLYSVVLLVIIYVLSVKQEERESLQYRIYMMMIRVTILLLILDIFGRFDGNPETIYPVINHIGNFLLFLFHLTIPSLWILYVYNQIFGKERKTKQLFYLLAAVNGFYAFILIWSLPHKLFYYIDAENIYHRGPLFPISYIGIIVLMTIAYGMIIKNRKKIEEKHYSALVFFVIPPLVGLFLQIKIYGIAFMVNSIVVSLFIIFLNIQQQSIITDYLTGINNRKKLDIYLKKKISMSSENQTFAAVMLDLNNFKAINDEFGHDEGDCALKTTVRLLSSCLRLTDFIARFGGDEFCIVLDISLMEDLEDVVRRIQECFEFYNKSGEQPYELSLSIGYSLYDFRSGMEVEEFQKKLDLLMYENKQNYKNQLVMG